MKQIFLFIMILLITVCLFCPVVHADIAVIVNKQNPVEKMTKQQVRDIFMGNYMAFPNGNMAIPLDQKSTSKVRSKFYARLTGKTVSQVNAYWAKKIFSGQATPPQMINDSKPLHDVLKKNLYAIAYIDSQDVSSEDKIVLLLQ